MNGSYLSIYLSIWANEWSMAAPWRISAPWTETEASRPRCALLLSSWPQMSSHAEIHHDSSSLAHFAQVHLKTSDFKVKGPVEPLTDHMFVTTSDCLWYQVNDFATALGWSFVMENFGETNKRLTSSFGSTAPLLHSSFHFRIASFTSSLCSSTDVNGAVCDVYNHWAPGAPLQSVCKHSSLQVLLKQQKTTE